MFFPYTTIYHCREQNFSGHAGVKSVLVRKEFRCTTEYQGQGMRDDLSHGQQLEGHVGVSALDMQQKDVLRRFGRQVPLRKGKTPIWFLLSGTFYFGVRSCEVDAS